MTGSKAVSFLVLLGMVWSATPKCIELTETQVICTNNTAADISNIHLSSVKGIILIRCNVAHVQKTLLDNFPTLTNLHASNAMIETIEPIALNGLKLLDWVDLSENKLTNIPVDLVAECPKIFYLNISHNQLVIPENKPFLNSINLKLLGLQNAGITKLYRSTFSSLPNLELLSLKGNLLENLPAELFQQQTKMVSLRLESNRFKHVSPDAFTGIRSTSLYLADNPWNCDCTLYPFILWTQQHHVREGARCAEPDTREWKAISSMKC